MIESWVAHTESKVGKSKIRFFYFLFATIFGEKTSLSEVVGMRDTIATGTYMKEYCWFLLRYFKS